MFDVRVVVMDFKTTIASESVTENSDGSYTIFDRQRQGARTSEIWYNIAHESNH